MPSTGPSSDRSTGRASVPGAIAPPSRPDRTRASAAGSGYPAGSGYGGGGGSTPRPPVPGGRPPGPRPRPKPRWGRIALVVLAGVLALAVVAALGAWAYTRSLEAGLARTDPFAQITGGRPAHEVDGALNILMLGTDSRDPNAKAEAGQWRTDTMMLMHVTASHDKAYIVSIPRDLYVYIPQSPSHPELGGAKSKINAAYAWGGLPLTVQTVEGFTGVRIDHVVLIDFGGFKEVTDALGGVDMYVEQDVTSIHKPFRHFRKGMNHFNGEEALDYTRQRYQFAEGDFARMRHQQQFLKALMDKATSTGTMTNPAKLNAFLRTLTKALTVDKDFSIVDMALQFRHVRSSDLQFLVSPNVGSQDVDGQSVVVSDRTKAAALYDAVAKDTVGAWVAQNVPPSSKPGG